MCNPLVNTEQRFVLRFFLANSRILQVPTVIIALVLTQDRTADLRDRAQPLGLTNSVFSIRNDKSSACTTGFCSYPDDKLTLQQFKISIMNVIEWHRGMKLQEAEWVHVISFYG